MSLNQDTVGASVWESLSSLRAWWNHPIGYGFLLFTARQR